MEPASEKALPPYQDLGAPPRPARSKPWRRRAFAVISMLIIASWLYNLVQGISLNVIDGDVAVENQPKKHKEVQGKQDSTEQVCLSPSCVHASSEILYNLHPNYQSIDACTNFEELVCGGWKERHDLRPDQGDAFTGTIMSENSQALLRHILEAPYPKNSAHSYFSPMNLRSIEKSEDEKNFDKMKAAYDACLDEKTIKGLGISPLRQIIDNIKNLYPATSFKGFKDQDNRLQNAISYLYSLGIPAIVSPSTGADDKDPDNVVVMIAPVSRIGLPAKELYDDEKVVSKYKSVVSQVFGALFFPARIEAIGDSLVDFETKLAHASPRTEDAYDVTKYYNPMTLEDASAMLPQVGLPTIVGKLSHGIEVKRVINASPSYLNRTSTILAETDDAVIQAYFIWKAVQSLYDYIEAEAIVPYRRFVNELQGKEPDSAPERWRTCVRHVDNGLGWILSRFFVEKAFSAKAKEFGDQMVTDIKTEFVKKLKVTKWMETKVIEKAVEKVGNIVQKIGYPTESPDIMDPAALGKYYGDVSVSDDAFFSNAVAMASFEIKGLWSALGKPVDRARWDMTVPTVNAYYNPPGNEIVFPAGIMQFPVFDVNVPQYLSYGAFASVAGHELSHAFDSTGRHYDQTGNYTDWWTNATVAAFTERADCFVSQYSNYSIDNDGKPLHVNGKLTLGENIADAGGVSAAFSAWKIRETQAPELNLALPGLQDSFSKEQLFFVSYANWWCGKSRQETAVQRIYTDPHAPKWARILGTMANSRDFLEAFQCEKKEPVCELW